MPTFSRCKTPLTLVGVGVRTLFLLPPHDLQMFRVQHAPKREGPIFCFVKRGWGRGV